METIKTVLYIFILFPMLSYSQGAIQVDDDAYPQEIISLVDNFPLNFSIRTTIANNYNEPLNIRVTTESKDFPSSWDIVDESQFLDYSGTEQPGFTFELSSYLTIMADSQDDVATGVETLRIVAETLDGTEVANQTYELSYVIELPEVPKPTFIITTFEFDSTIVDTIYIPLDVSDPFSKEFYSYLEMPFDDFFWVERPIVFEPIETILENIESIDCMHEDPYQLDPSKSWCNGDTMSLTSSFIFNQQMQGFLGPEDRFKMEFLMNIYDPIDSLNSNQQIRIIAKDSECIYGRNANIVDLPNNYAYTCPGGSVTINTRPQYGSVSWRDETNQVTYTGSEITFDNIQESIYLNVTTRDDEGCLLFQNVWIELEERYEEIVDIGEQEFEVCRGSDLTLNLLPGYDEAMWYNEMEGSTITAASYTLTDIQDYIQLIVRVANPDGCFSYQEVYIYINDNGIYAEMIQDSSWQLCYGGDLLLELSSEYSQVAWSIINTGEEFNGNTLELSNVTDYFEIELSALKNDGCTYRQYLSVYPNNDNNYNPDILLTDIDNGLCLKSTLEAADGFERYQWYGYINGIQELLSESQQLELDYASNPNLNYDFQLFVSGENGCGDFYEFGIYVKEPEEQTLIDASALGEYCEGDNLEVSVLNSYESYQWTYLGQTSTGPTFSFPASSEQVELLVIDEDGCAFRDIFYTTVGNLSVPSLCLITNDAMTGNNVLLWEDPAEIVNISKYLIYREGSSTNEYEVIGELDFAEENMFVDKDSDPTQQAYKYQIKATNNCGDLSAASNTHKTIHLTINQGTNGNVNLIWDSYEGISYDQIKIYRGGSLGNLDEYIGLPGNAFSFTDQNPPLGNVYYQIEVTTEIECEIGKALYRIKSNVAVYETEGDSVDELGLMGKVYPNPFSNFIYLELDQEVELQLVAMDGKRLLHEHLESGKHKISTYDIKPGAYILKVVNGNRIFAQTFIKTE